MEAVVDSNVLLGARLERDQWHVQGTEIVTAIDDGTLPRSRLIDFCLPEVLTPLENRGGDTAARTTLDFLRRSRGFEITSTTQDDFGRGLALYRKHSHIEVVDCVLIAHMRKAGIEHLYSFDDDFDRFDDVTRLTTADALD